jgi:chromosome segregation ATPase
MNTSTRVLVVLVLLLSVGFAASQIVLYGKRQDLSALLTDATGKLDKANKLTADLAKQLADAKDSADRTISDLKNQAQDLKSRLDDKTQQYAELEGKNTTLLANNTSLTEQTKGQAEQMLALNNNVKERDAKIADQGAQLTAKAAELVQRDETIKEKNAKIGEQEQQITAIKKEEKKLADANDDMMAQLQDLVRRGVDITPTYGPPIDAKIISVDAKDHTAAIDKGSVAGVKPNTQFTIYRDSTYVAKIVITDVDKQVAVGRVSLLAKGAQPMEGDDATTLVR